MMNSVFVSCPVCGALGIAGDPCEFCGTTIPQPKKASSKNAQTCAIVERQTIPAEEFAKKVSKYQRIRPWKNNLAIVSIGTLHGAINRNGDLVFPLNYNQIFLLEEYCVLDRDLYCLANGALLKNALEAHKDLESVVVHEGINDQLLICCGYEKDYNYEKDEYTYHIQVTCFDLKKNKASEFVNNKGRVRADEYRKTETLPFPRIKNLPQYNAYTIGSSTISTEGEYCFKELNDNGTIEIGAYGTRFKKTINTRGKTIKEINQEIQVQNAEWRRIVAEEEEKAQRKTGCASIAVILLALGGGTIWGIVALIESIFL